MHRDGHHTKETNKLETMKQEQQLNSQLYYIEISCTTLWHFEQYCHQEIHKKVITWHTNRITY